MGRASERVGSYGAPTGHKYSKLRVGRLRNNDIGWLEVGMADTEMTEGRGPGDE